MSRYQIGRVGAYNSGYIPNYNNSKRLKTDGSSRVSDDNDMESSEREHTVLNGIQAGDGVIGDFFSSVGNKLGTVANKVVDKVGSLVPTRQDFPPAVRELLVKQGGKNIKTITVGRNPVQSYVQKALNLLSGGKFKDQVKNMNYDDVFHLFEIVVLDDNTKMIVEKNAVVNMKVISKIPSMKDSMFVNLGKTIKFGDYVQNAVDKVGTSIYLYDKATNNCQKFISDLQKSNGLMNNELDKFINQDVVGVLSTSPSYVGRIADIATETAAKFDRVIHGANPYIMNQLPSVSVGPTIKDIKGTKDRKRKR